jgi:hypothetical protein
MPDDAFDRLLDLIPAPPSERVPVDWIAVERRLGLRLPPDYKRIIDTYGLGLFDRFLWILHPTTPNSNLRLDKQIEIARWALAEVNDVFAEPHELTAWARTENGDTCYWLTRDHSDDPDHWHIAVNESRGPDWEVFDLSTTGWLEAVLSGRLHIPLFPDDFPSTSPNFRQELST